MILRLALSVALTFVALVFLLISGRSTMPKRKGEVAFYLGASLLGLALYFAFEAGKVA